MIPSVGPMELLVILAVVVLLFGAKRIPDLARSLGAGAREFREGVAGKGGGETEGLAAPQGEPDGAADANDAPTERAARKG